MFKTFLATLTVLATLTPASMAMSIDEVAALLNQANGGVDRMELTRRCQSKFGRGASYMPSTSIPGRNYFVCQGRSAGRVGTLHGLVVDVDAHEPRSDVDTHPVVGAIERPALQRALPTVPRVACIACHHAASARPVDIDLDDLRLITGCHPHIPSDCIVARCDKFGGGWVGGTWEIAIPIHISVGWIHLDHHVRPAGKNPQRVAIVH